MSPRRRYSPLTEANSVGNGVPATADIVQVQNALFSRVDDLAADIGRRFERLEDNVTAQLKEGREDHRHEHDELRTDIVNWRVKQGETCAALMAPYASIGLISNALAWIGKHPKVTLAVLGVVLTAFFAAAAIIGGLLLPGR